MADYAGAVAAMRARFEANWTETPIAFQNEAFAEQTGPWVYFEVVATESNIRGAGLPGSQTWLTLGAIYVHVFTPEGYGYPESLRLADAAGEIFRAAGFYNDGAGSIVRTWAPQVDGGDSSADNGNWFRVTTRIPFEFYYRG